MMRKGPGSRRSRHEVSQRGAARRGDGERGQRPISTMQPPQTGAQIDAMTGEDCVALAIIGGFNSRVPAPALAERRGWLEAWRCGRRSPGSRSDGCGGTLSAARGAGSDG